MKRIIQIFLLFFIQIVLSQNDFSESWQDFYSYNNVKDFIIIDNDIYAVVDNAIFKYNVLNGEIDKISSVNGLSGETTTSLYYSKMFEKTIVGYETGLLEIIDKHGNITIAKDIVNYNYSGSKQINNITEYQNKLYLSTSFAIVEYDIENLRFGDTFFIGNQSTEIKVNQIQILDEVIYAATENGIFTASVLNPNLIDYKNWAQNDTGNFSSIEIFNSKIFTAKNSNLYTFINNTLSLQKSYSTSIRNLKASGSSLAVSMQRQVNVLDINNNSVVDYTTNPADEFYFNLNVSFYDENTLLLGTNEFGILKSTIQSISTFEEIHPEGPTSNAPFSISALNNHLWVVYGGYDSAYTPLDGKYPFSHFNGVNWLNTPNSEFNVKNLVNVTIDPSHENKVYISSWGGSNPNDVSNTGGMLIVENDEVSDFWNYTNSGLEKLDYSNPNYISTRINGSAFDRDGNLWIANAWVEDSLKKYSNSDKWFDFEPMANIPYGLSELIVDKINTIWMGSRQDGVIAYNENGDKKTSLTTEENSGSLPDLNVRTVKSDASNRLWIGTKKGLVVLYNASGVFNSSIVNAEPVIILDDGIAKKLLGDQPINSIAIDGADNKWFGTETGGVLQTNPNGSTTLQNFNKSNSPLPSNNVLKIAVDDNSGLVYFATDKGIVAFNSNVSFYGENMPEVYAFPNPSTKTNEFITIDGRNGAHLPNGTNVKIVDAAGNLVYETNVTEGDELYGGKVIWNKTNLAGKKVASGVYIVLLSANENSETEVAKIAIIN